MIKYAVSHQSEEKETNGSNLTTLENVQGDIGLAWGRYPVSAINLPGSCGASLEWLSGRPKKNGCLRLPSTLLCSYSFSGAKCNADS